MEEWKEYKLHEIGRIVGGATPPTKDSANYDGEISWITPKDLSNFTGRYIQKGERSITQKGFESSSCQILPKGSILFSSRAPIGYIAIAANELCTNQGFKSIIPDNNLVNNLFLYYLLKFNKEEIEGLGSGTTFKEVSAKVMQNFDIKIPSIQTQKKIADILSSLDDKIELNRRINDNLEQQAQALFKSWFVDFEPFKEGKFVDSELGRIPEGWRVERLGSVCKCLLGGTPSRNKEEYWNGKIAWINFGEINEFRITKPSEYITQEGLKKSATKLLPKKTTVLAITGATLGQVSLLEIDSCANQSVIGLLENEDIFHEYIYPLIKNRIDDLCSHMTGGAQQHINKNNVEQLEILVPPKKILVEYKQIATPIYSLISNICFESQKISKLRDSLLPRLMSGELKLDKINN